MTSVMVRPLEPPHHADTARDEPGRPSLPRASAMVEHLTVGALLLWWAWPMTRDLGGRGPAAVPVALLLVVAGLIAVRPWQHLSGPTLLIAPATCVGAVVGCLCSPSGWYGADAAASTVLAALTFLVVGAYARTDARRQTVVCAVVGAGAVELAEAFLPWWGSGSASTAMIGTFYWWNPFAAFLLPGALLGLALAVRGERPLRWLGFVAAPLCASGVLFSGSRATLALLVVSAPALLLALVAHGPGRRQHSLRAGAVVLLTTGAVLLLSGPPVFAHRSGLFAASDSRAARGETVTANSGYRLEFWHRAVVAVAHHPWFGAGPHELVNASQPYVPAGTAQSNLAHNGYLQALADGGLVLGAPFLLACVLLVGLCLRRLLEARRQDGGLAWTWWALPVATLASAAHSGVDFDWSHPSDLLLTSVLAALTLSLRPRSTRSSSTSLRWTRVPVVAAALLAVLAAAASWQWAQTPKQVRATGGSPAERAAQLHREGSRLFRDDRWAVAVMQQATGTGTIPAGSGVSSSDLGWAVQRSARTASVDPQVAMDRARSEVVLGHPAEAQAIVSAVLKRYARSAGAVADPAAGVLAATGDRDGARALLLRFLATGVRDDHAPAHVTALLAVDAADLSDVDRCAYGLLTYEQQRQVPSDPGPPSAGSTCTALLRSTS